MMASNLATVLGHPLLQHKLTLLRQKQTSTAEFRRLAREMSFLMCYEVTCDLPLEMVPIETPLEPMQSPILSGKKLCFVSILRAGNGILEGLLDLVPSARVGHIGLYREPVTLVPIEYYLKLPADIGDRWAIVVDHAGTGHSAAAAVSRLKEAGAAQIRFLVFSPRPKDWRCFRRLPRRARFHGGDRPRTRRPRLYPTWSGRRGRPAFRDEVS